MKKQLRTDVLMGKQAETFAQENTNFYLYNNLLFNGKGFTILQSIDGDKYYLAKIAEKQKFFSGEVSYFVEMIRPEPIVPVIENNSFQISKPKLSFGCDVVANKDGGLQTLYFGDSLYQFKTEEDRNKFELFCLECCPYHERARFDRLDELGEYFSDPNFVLMAKDKAFFLAFKIAEDMTTVGRNLLEHKIKKEIDKRVAKYANKSNDGVQMGDN